MKGHRVIVVGAGAAGLMAAGQAADQGADVLLLEKMDRPGRKLRITGKGRCNLTNTAELPEAITHFGSNGRFLRQAFSSFFNRELIDFFETRGVPTVIERGGRVFPASGQARDVADALVQWIRRCGVIVKTRAQVDRLIVRQKGIVGIEILQSAPRKKGPQRQIHKTDSVIIATGGASYPATGSSGDGYTLAEFAGHHIKQIRPALVPLETAGDTAERLRGLNLRNVSVKLRVNGKKLAELFGEMSFTPYGVTGPIILSLSRQAVDALARGHQVALSIDLKPALDERKLDARLIRDFNAQGRKPFRALLRELVPKKLIPVCVDATGIAPDKPGHQLNAGDRKRLRKWLAGFRLEVTGHRSFDEAIVTAGGVDTQEVDPRSMASRLVKGLFFAGEVLDLDADTGGYNLQAAFSTGWLAGRSAAKPL